jgi:hypothetical protein
VEKALLDENEKKESRKLIYLDEKNDTQYWEQIYKDTDCKFPIEKLYVQMDHDVWVYERFYETGEYPTNRERRDSFKELRLKYKRDKNG